jgi:hypothetical protein
VNAVHRAGVHAEGILGAGVGNYVCHSNRGGAIGVPYRTH